MKAPGRSRQCGFSLLEVLVSGAILSSGLAGLAALLLASVSGTAQSGYRVTASLLADSMVAQVQINPASRDVFLLEPPTVNPDCSGSSSCSPGQFATSNLSAWKVEVSRRLPGGEGIICRDDSPYDGRKGAAECDGGNQLVIKVFWNPGARLGPAPARVVKAAL